jgi:serine/threonine-protein kinase ATR
VRDIVHPYLSSTYRKVHSRSASGISQPFFRHFASHSFRDWMITWTGDLLTQLQQSAGQADADALRIFDACRLVSRQHINTASFVIPHLVLAVLFLGHDASMTQLQSELKSVLSAQPPVPDTPVAASVRFFATHTVFSIIDHLSNWVRWARREVRAGTPAGAAAAAASSAAAGSTRRQGRVDRSLHDRHRHVERFLALIPDQQLAEAAVACQDYTRALRHLEAHLQPKQRTVGLDAADLDQLQQIYARLGPQIDGMDGVAMTRRAESSLDAQLLDHRAAGRWSQALSCYERALQLYPGDPRRHTGLLDCQLFLGHLETAITHATGMMSLQKDWTAALNQYRVEAACKLGDWDHLRVFLHDEPATPGGSVAGSGGFKMHVGHLVRTALDRDVPGFLKVHEHAVGETMSHVSTISNAAAYDGAYKHILQLHILRELHVGLLPLAEGRPGAVEQVRLVVFFNKKIFL